MADRVTLSDGAGHGERARSRLKIFDTEDLKTPAGPGLVEIIDARIGDMAAKYSATYPSAMKALTTDRERADRLSAVPCRAPQADPALQLHRAHLRRETRRRTKIIGRLPGETSCLTLVWAVLDRASAGWRGLAMTSGGLRLLQDLRRSLFEPPRQLRPRTVTATEPDDQPETVSTVA